MEERTVFELQNVVRCFTKNSQVTMGSLSLPCGRIIAILGRSGCGKTTLLNTLSSMDGFDEGEVVYHPANGSESSIAYTKLKGTHKSAFRKKRFGFVFQNDHLMDNFSSLDNCRMPSVLNGYSPDNALLKDAFEIFDLQEKLSSNPGDLSGGQRSRIGIIRSFLHNPEVIFADEPTADLDEKAANRIFAALKAWKNVKPDERTLIFVTHDRNTALHWADFFIVFPQKKGASPVTYDARNVDKSDAYLEVSSILGYSQTTTRDGLFPSTKQGAIEKNEAYEKLFVKSSGANERAKFPERLWNFLKYLHYDFFRHKRKNGNVFVMWGPPLLLIFILLFLSFSTLFISGVQKGTTDLYNKVISNPFLWHTYVIGNNVAKLPADSYESQAGFHRLLFCIRNPEIDYSKDFLARTIRIDDSLLPLIAKNVVSPASDSGLMEKFQSNKNAFGVVITKNALKKVGFSMEGDDPSTYPREIEMVFYVDGGKGRGGEEHVAYIPVPVLGVADQLPFYDVLVSEGFYLSYRSGRFRDKLMANYGYFEPMPAAAIPDEESLKRELASSYSEIAKLYSLDPGLRLDENALVYENVDGKRMLYVGFENPKDKVFFFVLRDLVERAFEKLDARTSDIKYGAPCFTFADADVQAYRHWSFVMTKSIGKVEEFIELCKSHDLFIDTSIKWRVESLENSIRMFKTFLSNAFYGIAIAAVFIIILIFIFDCYRRIHNIGVFFAMGGSLARYLAMGCIQIAFTFMGTFLLTKIFGDLFLFEFLSEKLNSFLSPGTGFMAYKNVDSDCLWYALYTLLFLCACISIVKFSIFNKTPAELIRYQD